MQLESVIINSFIDRYKDNDLLDLGLNHTLTKEEVLSDHFRRPLLKHYLIRLLDSGNLTKEENISVNSLLDEVVQHEFENRKHFNRYEVGVL